VEWSRWVIYCYYGCKWDSWKWWLVEAKSEVRDGSLLLLVPFPLVNAPSCHLSLVLASIVQGDAVNYNMIHPCTIMNFYFASWGKTPLELFCLQPNMIGWRQNSCSSAFASWGKMDIAFWHFQNLTRQCLFCLMKQKQCWSYFAIRKILYFWLFKWQGRNRIHLDWHKVLATRPKTPNLKPNPKPNPQINLHTKPRPNTQKLNLKLNLDRKPKPEA